MTTIFLKSLHRNWAEDYDERIIGSFDQMHPLALKILDECSPRYHRTNERYEKFIASYVHFAAKEGVTVNPDELKQKIPQEKFGELMSGLALGVQYASRKTGGLSVPAYDYAFKHTYHADGKKFKDFGAMATSDGRLLIHPATMVQLAVNLEAFKKGTSLKCDGFNAKEIMTLIGAEEMLHFYQLQQGRVPQYQVENLNNKEHKKLYNEEPMEIEADILQDVATRELRLGPKNRGLRR